MVWHSDLVKQAVQLANDGIDLLRKVTRIHAGGCRARPVKQRRRVLERRKAPGLHNFGLRV